jgi:hypothetical protein
VPTIRRNAEVGDIIVGTGSKRIGLAGRLIYAMRVSDVLPFKDYWTKYPNKRPSLRSPIAECGDNIWHRIRRARRVVPNARHGESQQRRDLSGENALVSTEFFYFGRDAIRIPSRFQRLLATTQGHKNTQDREQVDAFWSWLVASNPRKGRLGRPTAFRDRECDAQFAETDDDCTE